MEAITITEMRRLEAASDAAGVSYETLMWNAGYGATQEIQRHIARHPAWQNLPFLVVAGKGNNGGDACVVARCLAERGHRVTLLRTSPENPVCSAATPLPPQIKLLDKWPRLLEPTIIVDGLLGTGLHGNATGLCAELIAQINASGCPVVSLDIPSGLNGDNGEGEPAVIADLTITMAYPKIGMLSERAQECCGELRVIPIGLPKDLTATPSAQVFSDADAHRLLPPRSRLSHKNIFGHLLCLAGSAQYTGAPLLASEAALRSGAGLVTLAAPAAVFQRQCPAALITLPLPGSPHFTEKMLSALAPALARATVLLFGPGITQNVPLPFLQHLLATDCPLVIDADGLRLLAQIPADSIQRTAPLVLTPHPGEMLTLLATYATDKLDAPRDAQAAAISAALGAHVVLKGHHTVVSSPDGTVSINLSGGPSLATAGTGDVLAGVIAGLLCTLPTTNCRFKDIVRLAVFLHGRAGDLWPHAPHSLLADDLLHLLPLAFENSRILDT